MTVLKPLKKRLGRTVIECVAVAGFVLGGTAASQAFTPDVAEQVEHFWYCFGLMITDPDAHATECGPGKFYPRDPLSTKSPSYSPPTTTTYEPSTTITVTAA